MARNCISKNLKLQVKECDTNPRSFKIFLLNSFKIFLLHNYEAE